MATHDDTTSTPAPGGVVGWRASASGRDKAGARRCRMTLLDLMDDSAGVPPPPLPDWKGRVATSLRLYRQPRAETT